jgi:hypothetical protein
MAKVVTFNHTDTAISGSPTNATNFGLINYVADWRVESKSATEAVIVNMRSPIGTPERFRFASGVMPDVFVSSGIEAGSRTQTKRGVSILVQHTDIASVTDTVDATFAQQMPFSMNIVLKIPANEYVTGQMALDYMKRSLAGLFETGLATSARLDALLRGSVLPVDMK